MQVVQIMSRSSNSRSWNKTLHSCYNQLFSTDQTQQPQKRTEKVTTWTTTTISVLAARCTAQKRVTWRSRSLHKKKATRVAQGQGRRKQIKVKVAVRRSAWVSAWPEGERERGGTAVPSATSRRSRGEMEPLPQQTQRPPRQVSGKLIVWNPTQFCFVFSIIIFFFFFFFFLLLFLMF